LKNGDGSVGLAAKQEQAAFMLAAGSTVTDAAAAVGADRATVSMWQRLPEFQAFVNRERAAARAASHGKLISLNQKAEARLETLLDSHNERIVLGAIGLILQHAPAVPIGLTRAADIERAVATSNLLDSLQDSLKSTL
jgi:hypothetical protein